MRDKNEDNQTGPGELSPENVLRARARKLAQPAQSDRGPGDGIDVLEFRVAEEHYALPLSCLFALHSASALTGLPGMPGFIHGVISVRGQVVSVMDLAVLLGLPPSNPTADSLAVVLGTDTMVTSLLAHEVKGLMTIRGDEIDAGESWSHRLDRRFIDGVTQERVILLAGEKLLSDPGLIVTQ